MCEFPEDKKIARVRVYEKHQETPGGSTIHGLEFFDEAGVMLGVLKSRNNPRSSFSKDIMIAKNEKIVGTYQYKENGITKALGFLCMHNGMGYTEARINLDQANRIPYENLRNLKIGPNNAIVRAEHACQASDDSEGSHHNIIWPKLSNNSDTWNKWSCN